MNWGTNLTRVGTIRVNRWLTLATAWGAINKVRFVAWVDAISCDSCAAGDVVVMDSLPAHKTRAVRALIESVSRDAAVYPALFA